jgi:tRNA modification GTPase
MQNLNLSDTIAAIATSPGESGIGIVRISGDEALNIANRIFVSKDRKKPLTFKTHTVHYGWIVNGHASEQKNAIDNMQDKQGNMPEGSGKGGHIIDEVLLTIMRAPKSYTREDVIEIGCHGGIVTMRRVLDLVLENGCRLAQPGEFTKRAFINGRIDLSQAEAVLDVVKAKTESALKIGIEQLRGGLSRCLNKIRKVLLDNLVVLEANIDFSEEETSSADGKEIIESLKQADKSLKIILDGSEHGRIFREGISVVICGKPNVGKSSLLNTLLKQERSIVTAVAGTTRDTIEEVIDIKGIPMRIVDTAGILHPRDLIEKKAVWRTKRYIQQADLVILLFDGSKTLTQEDELLIRKLKKKVVLAVINKIDLRQKLKKEKILKTFSQAVLISAKKSINIDILKEAIANLVYKGKARFADSILVSNLRQIQEIKKTQKLIAEAIDLLDNKLSGEFIAQNIKDALGHLDEVLGKRFSEDLLDKIFSEFCIGK